VRERLLDAVAVKVGIDGVEVRRRNLIPTGEMPFTRALETLGTDIVLDSGDYAKLLDTALDGIGWAPLQAQIAERRKAGELVGAGIGMFVEKSGLGPFDDVCITVGIDGKVEVVTGAASVGQGVETVIAQICAEKLGVSYDTVSVIHGQTDRIARGLGAFASRVSVMTGEATRQAALKLRDKALAAAAELMQLPADQLDIVDGEIIRLDGSTGPSMSLAEIAKALAPGSNHVGDNVPGLFAEASFESKHMTYPYGVHVAVVSLARDTGGVLVERYLVAYDIGKAINPMLVEGQIVGGVAQGLGGALYEEFSYDDRGEPLAVTFADYLMPTAREVPDVEVIITEDAPSPLNPMGLKGAGEGGANAVGAAIAAAIDDALGQPGAITKLPVSPQRVKELINTHTANEQKP
jgi:carbon-monoxide dehydrogenase large subunit/6-hydroxypseudooxynicotine dehydrogenase subunit gamma